MATFNQANDNRTADRLGRRHQNKRLGAGLVVLLVVAVALLIALSTVFAHTIFGSVTGASDADLSAGLNNADYDVTFTVFSPNLTAHSTKKIVITFPAGYTLDSSEAAISGGTDGLGTPNKIDVDGSEVSSTASASTSGQDFIVELSDSIDFSRMLKNSRRNCPEKGVTEIK